MSTLVFVAAMIAPLAALVWMAVLAVQACGAATNLNLEARESMKTNEKLQLTISPTDAEGNPARVTDIVWTVRADVASASVNTTTPDMLSAELVCDVPDIVTVTVEAKNVLGVVLFSSLDVRVDAAEPVATHLNLVAGPVSPRT